MNVFIIEDSPTISLILERTLNSYGYITYLYSSSDYFPEMLKEHRFDLFIIDTNLDKSDSTQIVKQIREVQKFSYIIGINHKGSWVDRIDFLKNGADDCLTYPFPPEEILARIQAVLRRPKTVRSEKIKYGKFTMDPSSRHAYYGNKLLNLSNKEYSILEYLVRNKGRSLTRNELMDHIWDYRKNTVSNTIDVHITRLRRKILKTKDIKYPNPDNIQDEIKTVHGVGYKMSDNLPEKKDI